MPYIGRPIDAGDFKVITLSESFDGNRVDFTMSESVGTVNQLIVVLSGVVQHWTDAYTVSGTTLTFTRAPHNNAEIFVRHIKKEYKNETTDTYQQYKFENGRNHYKLNSDGKLVKVENKKMPVDEVNFPDDVTNGDFASYNGSSIVNATTWSV